MASASSQVVGTREPVYIGKERIAGLFSYCNKSGEVAYHWSRRVDGRMRRGTLRTVGTLTQPRKTDAVNEYRALFADVQRGEVVIGDRTITVRKLVEDFLDRESGPLATRSKDTIRVYRLRLEKHVVREIGSMKCDDVTVAHIRRLLDKWKREGQSGGAIKVTVAALASAFRHGIFHLGLAKNPVADLQRGELPSGRRQTEPRYLTVDQVEKLLGRLSDEFRGVGACLFYGGMRVSEALALNWEMIDFDAKTVAVPGTKTASSAATIRLLDPLAEELKAQRKRQAAKGFDRVAPSSPVFLTKRGRRPDPRGVLRAVNVAGDSAGLVAEGQERIGPHDLRHSLAAYAFSLGLTPVEVSKLMRHSNAKVTLSVYAGVAGENPALDAGDKIAAGLGGGS